MLPKLYASFFAAFFGALQIGSSLFCLNFVENFGKCWIFSINHNLNYTDTCENATSRSITGDFDEITLQWALCVSTISIGGLIGALIFGAISDKYGRKQLMLVLCAVSIISTILAASSWLAKSVVLLQIGRFFIGIGCGGGQTIYTVYLAEIAPAKLLGFFGTSFTIGLTGAAIFVAVLGTEWILSTYLLWPLIMLVSLAFNLGQLVCLFFAVESPVYLLRKGNASEAAVANELLYGVDSESETTDTILKESDKSEPKNQVQTNQENSESFSKNLKNTFSQKHIKVATFHLIITYWNQNLTGIPALMMFSNAIFQQAGIPPKFTSLASIGFFMVDFLSSFAGGLVVDKWGRKLTYTISCIGMGVCLFSVFVLSFFKSSPVVSYGIILPVCSFNLFSQIGCMPIPFMLAGEWVPVKKRGIVQSIGVFNGFLSQFIVVTLFPLLVNLIDNYVFLVFVVFDCLAAVHIWLVRIEMSKAEVDNIFLKRASSFVKVNED